MTVPDCDRQARVARRKRLFGRPVVSMEDPELLRWLRNFANAHPNPGGTLAREARRWLAELERADSQ
jgi:hypothetical protein